MGERCILQFTGTSISDLTLQQPLGQWYHWTNSFQWKWRYSPNNKAIYENVNEQWTMYSTNQRRTRATTNLFSDSGIYYPQLPMETKKYSVIVEDHGIIMDAQQKIVTHPRNI